MLAAGLQAHALSGLLVEVDPAVHAPLEPLALLGAQEGDDRRVRAGRDAVQAQDGAHRVARGGQHPFAVGQVAPQAVDHHQGILALVPLHGGLHALDDQVGQLADVLLRAHQVQEVHPLRVGLEAAGLGHLVQAADEFGGVALQVHVEHAALFGRDAQPGLAQGHGEGEVDGGAAAGDAIGAQGADHAVMLPQDPFEDLQGVLRGLGVAGGRLDERHAVQVGFRPETPLLEGLGPLLAADQIVLAIVPQQARQVGQRQGIAPEGVGFEAAVPQGLLEVDDAGEVLLPVLGADAHPGLYRLAPGVDQGAAGDVEGLEEGELAPQLHRAVLQQDVAPGEEVLLPVALGGVDADPAAAGVQLAQAADHLGARLQRIPHPVDGAAPLGAGVQREGVVGLEGIFQQAQEVQPPILGGPGDAARLQVEEPAGLAAVEDGREVGVGGGAGGVRGRGCAARCVGNGRCGIAGIARLAGSALLLPEDLILDLAQDRLDPAVGDPQLLGPIPDLEGDLHEGPPLTEGLQGGGATSALRQGGEDRLFEEGIDRGHGWPPRDVRKPCALRSGPAG